MLKLVDENKQFRAKLGGYNELVEKYNQLSVRYAHEIEQREQQLNRQRQYEVEYEELRLCLCLCAVL